VARKQNENGVRTRDMGRGAFLVYISSSRIGLMGLCLVRVRVDISINSLIELYSESGSWNVTKYEVQSRIGMFIKYS